MDVREEFANALQLEELRVVNFPSLIFLCGGPVEKKKSVPPFLSARHLILSEIRSKHPDLKPNVRLAEELTDWFRGGLYKSLLEFEEDIAGLSSSIPLFLESPGSIAELGSFVKIPALRDRLVVFVREEHYGKNSFIYLGPILELEEATNRGACVFPWKTKEKRKITVLDEATLRPFVDDIIQEIKKRSQRPKTIQFKTSEVGHKILLMCDIIDMIGVARQKDIITIFEKIGLGGADEVRKWQFILEKLDLIKQQPLNHDRFLIPKSDMNFISYTFKNDAKAKDRLRWTMLFADWIKRNEPRRLTAVRHAKAEEVGV